MTYRPEFKSEITPEFLYRELERISQELELIRTGHYDITYVEPSKPRSGDIRYADGTEWNPGAGEGLYRYNISGSWVRLNSEKISVREYGAVGDGVTDDTDAIQAAIDAAHASSVSQPSVFFPAGQYELSDDLDAKNVILIGDGSGRSGGAVTRLTFSSTYGIYSTVENNHGFSIKGMDIFGSASKTSNGQTLIDFTGQNYPNLSDVRVWQAEVGILLAKGTTVECNYGYFDRVDANQCVRGIEVSLSTPAAANSHSFHGGRHWDNLTAVKIALSHSGVSFFGTSFESNDTYGIDSEGQNISFFGCRFENPSATNVYVRSGSGAHWFFGGHWSSGTQIQDDTTHGVCYFVSSPLSQSTPGPAAWRSATSTPNLLANGSFIYDPDGDGTPEPWAVTWSNLATHSVSLTSGDVGGQAVLISNTSTNNLRLYQQVTVITGATYTLSYRIKVSTSSAQVRLSNSGTSGSEYANASFSNTSYQWYSTRFTATSNTLYVSIFLSGTTARDVTCDAMILTAGIAGPNMSVAGHLSEDGGYVFGASTVYGKVTADTIAITDGVTAPSAVSGTAQIYVDTADGDLKVIFGDGTAKTIVTDT